MLNRTNLQQLFLLVLAGICLALCYVIVEPYIGPIVSATAMAVLFYPLHAALLRRIPGRESTAAGISLLLVIALIVAPSIWITWTMSNELSAAYSSLKSRSAADGGWIEWAVHTGTRPLIYFGVDPTAADDQVRSFLSERVEVISGTVLKLVQGVVSNIALFLFNAIIALFVLFFLLRDGDQLIIPKIRQEVTVLGEVQNGTSHLYRAGLSRDDYVNLSGGLTHKADKSRIYVVKPDGSVVSKTGWLGDVKTAIQPGDTIVAPLDTERLPPLPFWQAVTSIIYNAAVAVAAIGSL